MDKRTMKLIIVVNLLVLGLMLLAARPLQLMFVENFNELKDGSDPVQVSVVDGGIDISGDVGVIGAIDVGNFGILAALLRDSDNPVQVSGDVEASGTVDVGNLPLNQGSDALLVEVTNGANGNDLPLTPDGSQLQVYQSSPHAGTVIPLTMTQCEDDSTTTLSRYKIPSGSNPFCTFALPGSGDLLSKGYRELVFRYHLPEGTRAIIMATLGSADQNLKLPGQAITIQRVTSEGTYGLATVPVVSERMAVRIINDSSEPITVEAPFFIVVK